MVGASFQAYTPEQHFLLPSHREDSARNNGCLARRRQRWRTKPASGCRQHGGARRKDRHLQRRRDGQTETARRHVGKEAK